MANEATKVDDGGPAFPVAEDHRVADSIPWTCGMSLRDWFAGQALAGMLSDPDSGGHPKIFAECAYAHADAMLAARKAGAQ